MTNITGNICSRCGKQRIVVSVIDEVVGTFKITRTETACPNPDCQKHVIDQLDRDAQRAAGLGSTYFGKRPTFSKPVAPIKKVAKAKTK